MIVTDTDVLIDFLAGKGAAKDIEGLLLTKGFHITAVSRFELLAGAKTPKLMSRAMELLEGVPTLPLDIAAADAAAEVRRHLERSGDGIGTPDTLIAGIVLTNSGRLMTRNRRHFERVPGLVLV